MALPTGVPAGYRASRRPGCLGYGGMLFVVIVLVGVVGHPWSLHMGGRWTPAMVWHGYGKVHSSTGANYPLWLNIGPMATASRRSGKRDNFQGTAILCTPDGQALTLDVFGRVHAWLDADGQPMKMVLSSPRGSKPAVSFRLEGGWFGEELRLDDGGSMADSFKADGTPKGFAQGLRAPAERAQATLRYGKKTEFAAFCSGTSSF